jgi:hypothetical protein
MFFIKIHQSVKPNDKQFVIIMEIITLQKFLYKSCSLLHIALNSIINKMIMLSLLSGIRENTYFLQHLSCLTRGGMCAKGD